VNAIEFKVILNFIMSLLHQVVDFWGKVVYGVNNWICDFSSIF